MTYQSDDNKLGTRLPEDTQESRIDILDNIENNNLIQSEELVKKIPLYSENFDVTKKIEKGNLRIEKKWVTTNKKIEIPVRYQELFINDKEFDSYSDKEIIEIFSKIKNKLSEVFLNEKSDTPRNDQNTSEESNVEIINYEPEKERINQNILNEKMIPISGVDTDDEKNDQAIILELWGEEIIINKRMVKFGEIELKKYEVHEKRKVEVDIKTEKLILKFPNNYQEEIF